MTVLYPNTTTISDYTSTASRFLILKLNTRDIDLMLPLSYKKFDTVEFLLDKNEVIPKFSGGLLFKDKDWIIPWSAIISISEGPKPADSAFGENVMQVDKLAA